MTVYMIATPTIDRRGRTPDYSPARAHGNIKAVLDEGDFPTMRPKECLEKIYQRLEYFDPDKDHLLWAGGDTLSALMAGSVLSDFGIEHVSWLRFDRRRDPTTGERIPTQGIYVPVTAPLFLPEMD